MNKLSKKELIEEVKEYGKIIILAILIGLLVKNFVFMISTVPTGSMIPTVQINDKVYVSKIFSDKKLKYGDIIVFNSPVEENKLYLKRVIGIEGDIIEVKNGFLFINNKKIKEDFLAEPINYNYGPITVPKGKLFVLGDNRNKSFDSHLWATPFVDIDEVIGKGTYTVYPFNNIGKLK